MEPEALLELADDAAGEGEYESACHLLMAALHLAEHRADYDAVLHVGAAGRRLGVAAVGAGRSGLFEELDARAEAARLRLERAGQLGRAPTA
ncbi:MAG TPA: hypothetical protein VF211_03995 [Burkholderiales bacterium]